MEIIADAIFTFCLVELNLLVIPERRSPKFFEKNQNIWRENCSK